MGKPVVTYSPLAANAQVPPIECAGDDEVALRDKVEHRLALQRLQTQN